MYPINDAAYHFELIKFTNSLFDNNTINATYIIYLEGNGRYEHIINEINKFKTTKTVYILHNKGYKTGLKDTFITKPPLDLVDAYITIFKHASNNNFKNILIFEDDFMCDEKLLDTSITKDICSFINSKSDCNFIYYLGLLPFITSKSIYNHRYIYVGMVTHSVIYSSKFFQYILNTNQQDILDWDVFLSQPITLSQIQKYMYDKCLCYQPFPETENSKYWGSDFGIIGKIHSDISKLFGKLLKMDTHPKETFNTIYKINIKL